MTGISGSLGMRDVARRVANMAMQLGARESAVPFRLASCRGCSFAVSLRAQAAASCDSLYRADDGALVAIDGEVHGLDAQPNGAEGRKAARFYAQYQREGPGLLTRVRGAFSIAIWQPASRSLTLLTDPYGLRSLYYARQGRELSFGSRVRSVLAALPATPEVDEDGLADFILLGMPMAERTMFRGIELVPPASVLTFQDERLRIEPYTELSYTQGEDAPRSLDEAACRLHDAFLTVGAEQMGGPYAYNVPLSGGLDSRIVAALARRCSSRVSTFTMGDHSSLDLRLAPQVARSLSLPNQAFTVTPSDWIAEVDACVHLTDGMYNPMDAQIMLVARRLSDPAAITLDGTSSMDGYFRFFDPLLLRLFPGYVSATRHAPRVAPDALVNGAGELAFAPLARSEFVQQAVGRVRRSLAAMLEAIPASARGTPFDAMDHMDQLHRVRRFNMMGTVLLRGASEVRHPFFDPRVTRVIRSLRSAHRSREKIVLGQVLRRLSPKAARVPYERTGMRADASPLQHTLRYAKLATERALGLLLPRPEKRMTPVIDYRRWCREEPVLQAFVRDTVGGPHSQSAQLLGRSTLDAVLGDCFAHKGKGTSTFLVGRLLAYELWRHSSVLESSVECVAAE